MRGLTAEQVLDLRLQPNAAAPLAVAFSGGGDSLALLLTAKAWADRAGRRLVALTVDHGLQDASAAWARWCANRASALGVEHRILRWRGPKPSSGLPAAARAARHALLADEARRLGAVVILIGHTADDVMEAAAMRAAGSTTPSPRDWSPSPAWPQGRGVFLLRPLIGSRRADLRAWLANRGEGWIEDPANDDPRYARARARQALAAETPDLPCARSKPIPLASSFDEGAAADLRVPWDAVDRAQPALATAALSAALLSASGGRRPPRGDALGRLLKRLAEGRGGALGGARIAANAGWVSVGREAGEFRRTGAPVIALTPGEPAVWDGRFEITSDRPAEVRPLAGLIGRLPRNQAARLKAVAPGLRPALPAVVFEGGGVTCPILAEEAAMTVRPLVVERFLAACGLVESEASIWRVAKGASAS